jgi:hypothetical protein
MQTPEPSIRILAERVSKLEAQNRRLKQAGIGALVLASTLVFMGQAQTNRVLEANAFHLKDATGKVRARLSMEGPDRPTLSFLDADGLPLVSLAGGNEPFLNLNRPGTAQQITLGANRVFYGLALYDKEIRAGLSVQHGATALDFFDESGKPQGTIATDKNGASILFTDPAGKMTSSWTTSRRGNSFFGMDGAAGKFRIALGKEVGGPSLELDDKDGNLLWSAP